MSFVNIPTNVSKLGVSFSIDSKLESVNNLQLQLGKQAQAVIKASDVMIAV
ncbi:hypothetical protein [Nostoc sp.]|uniref:hypothetical protein n=1 Tax=Nostoc sp. TaxID=1180 RepID=UPI002FF499E6